MTLIFIIDLADILNFASVLLRYVFQGTVLSSSNWMFFNVSFENFSVTVWKNNHLCILHCRLFWTEYSTNSFTDQHSKPVTIGQWREESTHLHNCQSNLYGQWTKEPAQFYRQASVNGQWSEESTHSQHSEPAKSKEPKTSYAHTYNITTPR